MFAYHLLYSWSGLPVNVFSFSSFTFPYPSTLSWSGLPFSYSIYRYNEDHARFEHGIESTVPSKDFEEDLEHCSICETTLKLHREEQNIFRAIDRLDEDCDSRGNYKFRSFRMNGETYKVSQSFLCKIWNHNNSYKTWVVQWTTPKH